MSNNPGDVGHRNALSVTGCDERMPEVVEGMAQKSSTTAQAGKFDGQSGSSFEIEVSDPNFRKAPLRIASFNLFNDADGFSMKRDFDTRIGLARPDDELAGLLQAGPFKTGNIAEAQASMAAND